ncbi:hypothetical protein PRIC1_007850 [Phytophthora ramorum]
MPLRGSASCAAFDVSTRKVPSLALVPRGHLKHATRAKKKVAGSTQLGRKATDAKQQDNGAVAEDASEEAFPSPPRPARRHVLGDMLEDAAEEQQEDNEESEEDQADDDGQAELRLGERFLNLMARMARLASQSLGDNPATGPPAARTIARGTTERVLSSMPIPPSPPPPAKSPQKSPLKSPKHVVRDVAKRLPRALQGELTFDICMLLPAPLNERQSPLRSPIRRKRLRKRVRRRRLRRRARRTWQASHASWPPHASADYIVDHSRQDIAGISASRLVERLGERKVNVQSLSRVISMPLPPLNRNSTNLQAAQSSDAASVDEHVEDVDSEHDSEDDDSEQEEEEEDADDESPSEHEETSEPLGSTADTATTPSPREPQELVADKLALPARKRALYHQPAWISPELHAWLVESGLFATKPRRELLP